MQTSTDHSIPVSRPLRAKFWRVSLFALVLGPLSLSAQQAEESSDVVKMDAFEVKGFRSSLALGIEAKRQAGQVKDLITAEEVGQFGDQNIGEALQRISGVSLTRNNGEGESVSIRGLSPVFTRVEIDGRSMAVTADQSEPGRDTLLSGFSSDLYNNIEVIKTPKAADIEGGVGGIVRLNTPDPLTIGKLSWGIEGSLSDAKLRDSTEPGFSGFYSNVFDDGRLGLLLSATYEDRDRRIDKVNPGDPVWTQASSSDPALAGAWYPERGRLESRRGELPKTNLNAKIQFMATPELELYANTVYSHEQRREERSRIQIDWTRGRLLSGTVDAATGTLVKGEFDRQRVDYNSFNRTADVDTLGATIGAKWENGSWKIKAEASATDSSEDLTEYTAQARVNRDGVGGYDITADPRMPIIYTASTTESLANIPLRGLSLQHRIIGIKETDLQLDVEREMNTEGITSWETGVRLASTEFERKQGRLDSPTSKANGDDITLADGDSPFVLDGKLGFGQGGSNFLVSWPSVDPVSIYNQWPSSEVPSFDDGNFYTITEDSLAAYLMANFAHDLGGMMAAGNIGVRVVRTDFIGDGRVNVSTATDTYVLDDQPTLDKSYTEPLPAFNLTLSPGPDSSYQIRGAITRAMTRPTISEINPSTEYDFDNAEASRGSPDLDPFLAWQYDLGIEFYFGETDEGVFAVNGFMKDVDNFIVPTSVNETIGFSDVGVPSQMYQVSTYKNGGTASISGLEVNLQTPFTFLPAPFNQLGGAVNYTYTDSEFTDENGNTFTFPGASKDTYNLVLYFETKKFSSRLAYNFRNDYLIDPSEAVDGSNALYGEGSGRLDLSVRYRFESGWRISLDALNLTDEQSYKYYDIPQRLNNFEFEGTIYSVSLAYTF